MNNNIKRTEQLEYDGSVNKNSAGSVILGRLSGPCADIESPTRNGRKYSQELWEKVFKNPIVQEYFNCGGIFGELGHPVDREETDMEKICVCMPEPPTKDKNGLLMGHWDILDTPNGRILKTLCQYGYKMGVSSRGSGDVITDYDGQESVDPDTYSFNAFDIVLLPAVKAARLNFTESLNTNKSLKQALAESLNNASESDRKIMQETLDNMNIKLDESVESVKTAMQELRDYLEKWYSENIASEYAKHVNEAGWDENVQNAWLTFVNYLLPDIKDESLNIDMAVDNDKAEIEELQNALKENKELTAKVIELQEKLSVGYAKEAKLSSQIDKYLKSIGKLTQDVSRLKPLEGRVEVLSEQLKESEQKITVEAKRANRLRESVQLKSNSISNKEVEIQRLREQLDNKSLELSNTEKTLTEQLEDVKSNLEIKTKEYSQKVSKANKLVEQYKAIANKAVDKYIESKARMLGVDAVEIKNKLSESYSFEEIDQVCDNLRDYKLNISKLPFRTTKESLKENIKITATPSKNESILPAKSFDDDVDEQLLNLAGLTK